MKRRDFIVGAAGFWLLTVCAQGASAAKKRLAVVTPATPAEEIKSKSNLYYRALFLELSRRGFTEHDDLVIDIYSGHGDTSKYGELAQRVVDAAPDVILCVAGLLSSELKVRTSVIPIVAIVADPVASGLVSNLARPDANLTGVTVDAGMELYGKRLSLLAELVPQLNRVGYLSSHKNWQRAAGSAVREASKRIGITLIPADLGETYNASAYANAFASLRDQRPEALLISDEPEHLRNQKTLIELAAKNKIPTMYPFRELTASGGLVSYSVNLVEAYRYAAGEIAQIFSGRNPSDIPFYQPTSFQLTINLRAAQLLNIKVPPALLAQADEVIE